MRTARWFRPACLAYALPVLGATGGCTGDGSTAPAPVVAVVVTPATMTLYPEMNLQLSAGPRDGKGGMLTRTVTWSSDKPGVASIDATGLVTAIAAGTAGITATAGGVSGGAMVNVIAPVQTVRLSTASDTVLTGADLQLTATLRCAQGTELVRPVSWSSDAPGVASVGSGGLVTGRAPGMATITAASEGHSASVAVTVLAPVAAVVVEPLAPVAYVGATVQLTATVVDGGGKPLARTVTWQSWSPAVASVDARGLVRGLSAGSAVIIASSSGMTSATNVTVLAPVNSIELSIEMDTVLTAQSVQLSARLRDLAGNALVRPVTWSSDAPGVVAVSTTGLAIGVSPGTATITAATEGVVATARLVVEARVLSVGIDPAAAVVFTGKTLQLTARVVDAEGNPLTRALTWASSQPGVATVTANGLVRGLGEGISTITVASNGVVGAANITVRIQVTSILQHPLAATIVTGETLPLVTTPRDAAGHVLPRALEWASDAPSVATVSSVGVVTGISEGVARITSSADGVLATTVVTVLRRAVSVVISPDAASLAKGSTLVLRAIARDAGGEVLERVVTWKSLSPGTATVDASGLVTGVATGATLILAQLDDVTDTAQVAVLEPVAVVRLLVPLDSVEVSESALVVAQPLDSRGMLLTRPVTWETSDPSVASVSGGLVVGVKPGMATITARSEGAFAIMHMHVLVPVAVIQVGVPATSLVVNETLSISASVLDAQGNLLNRAVRWETSNPAIARVDGRGVVTGVSAGPVTISAVSGNKRASVTLTVKPGVATVQVTASSTTLTPESPTSTVTATLTDTQGNSVQRPVAWTSSNPAVISVASTGPQSAVATLMGAGDVTITATADGKSGSVSISGKGPPTLEEASNNLSWPTIFADGFTILGNAVGTDAGLRPVPAESIAVNSLPFWYHLNRHDWLNTHYLQGGTNTWRAEWLDGSSSSAFSADVYWGDNLTHHTYNTHAVIHLEVALFARNLPTLRGFNMFALSGSGSDEIQGTDGTVGTFTPMLFTVHPRLVVEKIDTAGGNALFTIVDKKVADGLGQDGPGYYRGELNKAGKIVYGYNLMLKDLTVPAGQTKYGWYRLSFQLEDNVIVGGAAVPRRVSLDGLLAGDDSEVPMFVPKLDSGGKRSYIDIFISSASGGHSGG